MKTLIRLVIGIVVVLTVSCTHAPQLDRTSDQVAGFRTHYLEHNPDDPFKKDIMRGKVHKEMNYMQVLASWGLPNVRTGRGRESPPLSALSLRPTAIEFSSLSG